MKRLSAILISLVLFVTTFSQTPDSLKYTSLRPRDFRTMYCGDIQAHLIDVREREETKKIIKGAVIIPSKGNLGLAADTICKEKSLFIYCNHGNRSRRVAVFFYDYGFRKLYSLEGGIVAWREEGFPVVRGPGKKRR